MMLLLLFSINGIMLKVKTFLICVNAAFGRPRQDGATILTNWLPIKSLGVVGKLEPPYQSHQMELFFATGIPGDSI